MLVLDVGIWGGVGSVVIGVDVGVGDVGGSVGISGGVGVNVGGVDIGGGVGIGGGGDGGVAVDREASGSEVKPNRQTY